MTIKYEKKMYETSINYRNYYLNIWKMQYTVMSLSFRTDGLWANSVDPDQTAPGGAVWSGSTLFAIPSAPFGHITLQ